MGRREDLIAGHRILASSVGIEPPESFDLRVGANDGEAQPVRIARRSLLPALDQRAAVQRDRVDDSADRELLLRIGIAAFDHVMKHLLDRLHETVAHVHLDARKGLAVAAADLPRVRPHAILGRIEHHQVAAGGGDRGGAVGFGGRFLPHNRQLQVRVTVGVASRRGASEQHCSHACIAGIRANDLVRERSSPCRCRADRQRAT